MVETPKIGEKIYVETSLYLSHGKDDVWGGWAVVRKIQQGISAGEATAFVYVEEHPDRGYNWTLLSTKQDKLKKQFGTIRAKTCPDNSAGSNKLW